MADDNNNGTGSGSKIRNTEFIHVVVNQLFHDKF